MLRPWAQRAARNRRRLLGWLFLGPAVIFLVATTQVPFLMTVYHGFFSWNLVRPRLGRPFVGLRNYLQTLSDPTFHAVLLNTAVLILSVLALTGSIGLGTALLVNRRFLGRGLVRTILISPFLIMPVVTAVIWKNVLLNPTYGLLANLAAAVGLPRLDLLATHPMMAIVAMLTWQWTPFMMLILLAGLQSLPQELIDAVRIDGASPLGEFRYVVFPHLTRFFEVAILLETIFILQIFGEIFVTTSGGPGHATTNLPFYIYLQAFTKWQIGRSSAIGVIAVVLTNLVALVSLRLLKRVAYSALS